MSTKPQSSKIAGISAILIGLLDVLLIIYVVAVPADQRFDMGQFFINYTENPLVMSVAWIVLALSSILALAVVPAVYRLIREEHEEWAQIAAVVGIVGFATGAASFLNMMGHTPALAQAYVDAEPTARAAIVALGIPEIDPLKVIVMGAPGTWMLITNILAWRGGQLHRLHTGVGIILGFLYWTASIAMLIQSETLDLVAAGGGALFAPIWFIWLGIHLFKESE